MIRIISSICIAASLCLAMPALGQDTSWPSPEVAQMYQQARNYLSVGNFKQAIVTYQQAIQLAPDKMELYRDLGKAYYLSGDYKSAQSTLGPLLNSAQADDQSYQIMASSQAATGDKKKARNTLQAGMQHFEHSGLLYHELGKMYDDDNSTADALKVWLRGIQQDPGYHLNYFDAARTYSNTPEYIWTMLYGEIFLTMEQHTPRADDMRGMVLDAYKKLFSTAPTDAVPVFGKNAEVPVNGFEGAVRTTLLHLSPTVIDGITTENLTMLRTRFIIDWLPQYGAQYPFSLFAYQDKMIRDGVFEAYNESLFGKAENAQWYSAWIKFHTEAMPQLETWIAQHPYHPQPADFYNDNDIDRLFSAKKKK